MAGSSSCGILMPAPNGKSYFIPAAMAKALFGDPAPGCPTAGNGGGSYRVAGSPVVFTGQVPPTHVGDYRPGSPYNPSGFSIAWPGHRPGFDPAANPSHYRPGSPNNPSGSYNSPGQHPRPGYDPYAHPGDYTPGSPYNPSGHGGVVPPRPPVNSPAHPPTVPGYPPVNGPPAPVDASRLGPRIDLVTHGNLGRDPYGRDYAPNFAGMITSGQERLPSYFTPGGVSNFTGRLIASLQRADSLSQAFGQLAGHNVGHGQVPNAWLANGVANSGADISTRNRGNGKTFAFLFSGHGSGESEFHTGLNQLGSVLHNRFGADVRHFPRGTERDVDKAFAAAAAYARQHPNETVRVFTHTDSHGSVRGGGGSAEGDGLGNNQNFSETGFKALWQRHFGDLRNVVGFGSVDTCHSGAFHKGMNVAEADEATTTV